MVVNRLPIMLFVCAILMSSWAHAQIAPTLSAKVEKTEVQRFEKFLMVLEYKGPGPAEYTFPPNDGFRISSNSRGRSERTFISNGVRSMMADYSFVVEVTQVGEVTIPPIVATVNGQSVSTEPIVLTVKDDDPAFKYPIKVRVKKMTVKKGEWFWVYLESPLLDTPLPNELPRIDGLENASGVPKGNPRQSFVPSRTQKQTRAYRVRATKAGTVTIPSMPFQLNRQTVYSNPLELAVLDRISTTTEQLKETGGMPFVRMDVDAQDVYLGEPILLTIQLWQPKGRRIGLSARSRSIITPPSTEGFYVTDLDDKQFEAHLGEQLYQVLDKQQVLYPTKTGELSVGAYRYEGDLILSGGVREYFVEHGPYVITVKPLPAAPPMYTGAIGQFDVDIELSSGATKEGVPIELELVLLGEGNGDAVAAPVFPDLNWAHVAEPEHKQEVATRFGQILPGIEKRFSYTITPTRAGKHTIPAIDYAVFDPNLGDYQEHLFGPFEITVATGDDEPAAMVVGDETLATSGNTTLLIGSTIHPLMTVPKGLKRANSNSMGLWLIFFVPMLAYAGLVYRVNLQTRLATDEAYARSVRAKSTGAKRLQQVSKSSEPTEELFRAMVAYIGDLFNLTEQGMTSSDMEEFLNNENIPAAQVSTIVKLLKSCERARFGAQQLSKDEVRALVQAAQSALDALEEQRKQKGATQ